MALFSGLRTAFGNRTAKAAVSKLGSRKGKLEKAQEKSALTQANMNAAATAKAKYDAAGCDTLKAAMDKVKLSAFGRLKAVGSLGFGAFKKGATIGNVASAQVEKAKAQVVSAHKAAAAATNASAKFAQKVQANAKAAANAAQLRAKNAANAAEKKAANAAKAAAEAQAVLAGEAMGAAQTAQGAVGAAAAPLAVAANIPSKLLPATAPPPPANAAGDPMGAPAARRSSRRNNRRSSRRSSRRNNRR
jgi:hypothetical protein